MELHCQDALSAVQVQPSKKRRSGGKSSRGFSPLSFIPSLPPLDSMGKEVQSTDSNYQQAHGALPALVAAQDQEDTTSQVYHDSEKENLELLAVMPRALSPIRATGHTTPSPKKRQQNTAHTSPTPKRVHFMPPPKTTPKAAKTSQLPAIPYSTVFFPSTGTLIINMLAPPNADQPPCPDLSKLRRLKFLHHAFTLTLFLASDEITFWFALGSFTERFTLRQRTCFELGAEKLIQAGIVRGFEALLRAVLRLAPFAHMVFEWMDEEGGEIGWEWVPSEEQLDRHWKLCGRHGWACRRIE